ncbi:uncharacterized protein LOC131258299 [Magnolia sinica]|uniref:uncharacterized protein LOC131258299 n=1 Tax=Magnolia sinica TaxID=86752 RepID=UPI00265B6828|nr:uncharacterized protein LOC131258299 [Magnolia sinica]
MRSSFCDKRNSPQPWAGVPSSININKNNLSEIIQCKFTITKALLFKADRSSFDRLCQQTMYMDGILQFAVCVNRTVLQRSRPLILWAPTFEGHISKTIQMRRPFPTQLDDEVV